MRYRSVFCSGHLVGYFPIESAISYLIDYILFHCLSCLQMVSISSHVQNLATVYKVFERSYCFLTSRKIAAYLKCAYLNRGGFFEAVSQSPCSAYFYMPSLKNHLRFFHIVLLFFCLPRTIFHAAYLKSNRDTFFYSSLDTQYQGVHIYMHHLMTFFQFLLSENHKNKLSKLNLQSWLNTSTGGAR